ncbi:MAG: DEAD/DEAH box helicase, partial [Pseudomonadota bacterium]
MSFESLGLRAEILRAVSEQGYTDPTPIQSQSIPIVISGKDVMASAQTGTGKTAGFTLPLLQRLCENLPAQELPPEGVPAARSTPAAASSKPILRKNKGAQGRGSRRPIRALIVTPTRELAAQVGESVNTYSQYLPIRSTV